MEGTLQCYLHFLRYIFTVMLIIGPSNCSDSNGGCNQLCTDTTDGPMCSCLPGYTLDESNTTCKGV